MVLRGWSSCWSSLSLSWGVANVQGGTRRVRILRASLSHSNSPLWGSSSVVYTAGSAPSVPLSIISLRMQVEQGHRVVWEPSTYVTGQELKTGNRESNENGANSSVYDKLSTPLSAMYNNPNNNTRLNPYIVIKVYLHQYPSTLHTLLGSVHMPPTLG